VLTRETQERQARVYTVRNDNPDARTIVLEHPASPTWRVSGETRPIESTDTVHRFVVPAEPGQTVTLTVSETREDSTAIMVNDIDSTHLEVVAVGDEQQAALASAIAPIVAKRTEIAALESQQAGSSGEVQRIAADQIRLRENMKALGRSSAERRLLDRYTRQLERQEERLDTIKLDVEGLNESVRRAHRELAALVAAVSLDRTF
jgi:hypothetical protein